MPQENTFGSMITMARRRMGWNQQELADAFYDKFTDPVSRITVNRWENDLQLPSVYRLQHLVTLLGLSEEEADALYRAAAQASPRIHNIPFPQNPFFTGREMQLKRLGEYLQESGSTAPTPPVIISGLGGIGKTHLALEYAHKFYRDIYRAVFWMDAADEGSLRQDYVSLAHLLKLPKRDEDDVTQQIQAVKRWLEEHTNWLLIMDNADNLQIARTYMPVKPGGHILLTSRSQIVGNLGRRIELEEMDLEEGILFLLRRSRLVKDETEIATIAPNILETADCLANILGGIPLALDQAGAYIEETGASFAGYIQLYEKARHSILNRRGSSGNIYGDHPESVEATLELCVRKVCEEQPIAEGILYNFSQHFLSLPTPERYFQSPSTLNLDIETLNEVIAALRRYSLVKRNVQEKLLWIHPLVRVMLRDIISPDAQKYWGDHFFSKMSINDHEAYARTQALLRASGPSWLLD